MTTLYVRGICRPRDFITWALVIQSSATSAALCCTTGTPRTLPGGSTRSGRQCALWFWTTIARYSVSRGRTQRLNNAPRLRKMIVNADVWIMVQMIDRCHSGMVTRLGPFMVHGKDQNSIQQTKYLTGQLHEIHQQKSNARLGIPSLLRLHRGRVT